MPIETLLLSGVMLLALFLYFLLGGADFGGGVWDALATGPRKQAQRTLVAQAIGPVWESNHVWLIFAVVLLFGAFQRAFAVLTIALHVPLTLFLLGVVLRGSAFVFRGSNPERQRWGMIFGWASLASPFFLGVSVGAAASGHVRVEGQTVVSGFYAPWLGLFPVVVGLFALAQCALLAAVFLAHEASEEALKEDFRRRGLWSGVGVGGLALAAILASREGAPHIFQALTQRNWAWPFQLATGVVAVGVLVSLFKRRYRWARVLVGGQVGLILLGWVMSQYPWVVVPDVTLLQSASSLATQRAMLWATALGAPVLIPSLWLLFRVFKGRNQVPPGS